MTIFLNDDIKVDNDDRFKLIFICKSEPSDIYKYVFPYIYKIRSQQGKFKIYY